ncbi:hypothetical protein L9F63_001260 [Diploptera punctata]|uniref:Uncharacterized protein n=1 Tax=Diploptera punctata TaxID=6984 RepID=A0AAD8A440_DIPPU|nr:hypothetical protein L9F63_001260 [Diploptera punctata]
MTATRSQHQLSNESQQIKTTMALNYIVALLLISSLMVMSAAQNQKTSGAVDQRSFGYPYPYVNPNYNTGGYGYQGYPYPVGQGAGYPLGQYQPVYPQGYPIYPGGYQVPTGYPNGYQIYPGRNGYYFYNSGNGPTVSPANSRQQ